MSSHGVDTELPFVKGHGTENDFVLLPDHRAQLDLTPQLVAALCDRRAGIGGDGLLRVARTDALCIAGVLDEIPAGVATDDWFMDYRNADGSIAEMCGNGVRVFAHHLVAAGLVDGPEFVVGSRAGGRRVHVHSADAHSADVTVEMGPVTVGDRSPATLGRTLEGVAVDVGNPHLACVVDDLTPDTLRDIDFSDGAEFDRDLFPHGVNIEILTPVEDGAIHMRVLERGVGETRSCGTGTVAAAAASLLAHDGKPTGTLDVHIPGGTVTVTVTEDGATLRGPSRIVAIGTVTRPEPAPVAEEKGMHTTPAV
ncbi:diaminopimelate epimerase [Williamsia deligens]|uniref:Diaminopimelate epimerase n=1 Tax=Williamsia deligens TaxID=321325 RepID=A0ABW3GC23_9NOCA|nr:diaminopimelate epimerase [Williamsia deligens]MCP2195432.1 diaminopimelate epimerase [Williamsia deligens]